MNRMDADLLERLKTLELETDPQFLGELIDMFLVSASKSLTEIVSGHQEKDARRLHIGAHTLKGSSGNIGAKRLAEICTEIEEASETVVGKEVAPLIEMVRAEFDRVQSDLTEFRKQGKNAGQT